jgi:hypothetical protein
MGTTQDTVYLTQIQLEDLLETLHKQSAPAGQSGGGPVRPVGRVEYEKRKYRETFTSHSSSARIEII